MSTKKWIGETQVLFVSMKNRLTGSSGASCTPLSYLIRVRGKKMKMKRTVHKILSVFLFFLIASCSGADTKPKQVKILYYSYTRERYDTFVGLSEKSGIAPFENWHKDQAKEGAVTGQTTIQEMVDKGWELKQIVPISLRQGYLYFAK